MSSGLQTRSKVVFTQIIWAGSLFLLVFFSLGYILATRMVVFAKILSGKLAAICGCTDHLSFYHHPYFLSFLILLSLGSLTFVAFIIKKTANYFILTKKYVGLKTEGRRIEPAEKLTQAAKQLGLENRLIEINDASANVFCFGFRRPKICISSGLVKMLAPDELKAVLLHEKQHLLNYEPLKIFIIKLISAILFFIPGLKLLADKYLILSELTADERATGGFLNKAPLARAIAKAIELDQRLVNGGALAVSFLSSTDARINKLLDDEYLPKFNTFTTKVLVSSLLPLVMLFSFILIAGSSQAVVESHNNSCPSMETEEQLQCNLTQSASVCQMAYNQHDNQCEEPSIKR